jgi:hypothetical protein
MSGTRKSNLRRPDTPRQVAGTPMRTKMGVSLVVNSRNTSDDSPIASLTANQ